ncbi:hypothetical protein PHMEG_0004611 [Phytophthora megakarya]|uniref:Uncharacterized protein n=1 Tax=Phytophthora megakarya TaxID=4795 RepID=A0A225WTJ4_9STRA|nr:hypothetical protein PHMEG_0004611 [Phytophthora megakarya]
MPLIKYRDPHRMEIRSLSKTMCEGRSFRIVWVHIEHEYAKDILLQRQRQELVVWIPSDCQVMVKAYSTWMNFDHALLLDDGLHPVVCNTLQYLYDHAQADLRRG